MGEFHDDQTDHPNRSDWDDFGYYLYNPSDEEKRSAFQGGLIVFDACALLQLYEFTKRGREQTLKLLTDIGTRVWLPHHVVLEFHENRESRIRNSPSRREKYNEFQRSANALLKRLGEFESHGDDVSGLVKNLNDVSGTVAKSFQVLFATPQEMLADDPVLPSLRRMKIGPEPTAKFLTDVQTKAGERYDINLPPGYKDASSKKDHFFWKGTRIQKRFGDAIIWEQILRQAESSDHKQIVFVTNDGKEDWWHIERGETRGPRRELVREILDRGNVGFFWMYKLDQFLSYAHDYLDADTVLAADEAKRIAGTATSGLPSFPRRPVPWLAGLDRIPSSVQIPIITLKATTQELEMALAGEECWQRNLDNLLLTLRKCGSTPLEAFNGFVSRYLLELEVIQRSFAGNTDREASPDVLERLGPTVKALSGDLALMYQLVGPF